MGMGLMVAAAGVMAGVAKVPVAEGLAAEMGLEEVKLVVVGGAAATKGTELMVTVAEGHAAQVGADAVGLAAGGNQVHQHSRRKGWWQLLRQQAR